jgi:hypothetical protein
MMYCAQTPELPHKTAAIRTFSIQPQQRNDKSHTAAPAFQHSLQIDAIHKRADQAGDNPGKRETNVL